MLGEDVQIELQELSSKDNTSRDGSWLLIRTSCFMTMFGKNGKNHRHPQWQISVAGIRSDGIFQDLKEVMSLKKFKKPTTSSNKLVTHQNQARLYLHEIAYAASRNSSERPPPQLPNNKATCDGGISHLCDQIGCKKLQPLTEQVITTRKDCSSGVSRYVHPAVRGTYGRTQTVSRRQQVLVPSQTERRGQGTVVATPGALRTQDQIPCPHANTKKMGG